MSNPKPTILRFPTRRLLAFATLIAIGGCAFANSVVDGEFIFDDQMWKQQLDHLPSAWSERFWLAGDEGPQHGRPLAAASLALNYLISGDNLAGYRLFNLTVHLLNGLLLFVVLERLLVQNNMPQRIRECATAVALPSAAIWIVHPLQTECVNYISQRTESLAALAMLATIYFALRSLEPRPERLGWMVLSVVAAWLGAGCKETVALAPLLVILIERTATNASFRERLGYYLALASVWIPVGILMGLAPRTETVGVGEKSGVVRYLLNQCLIIPDYFALAFWPQSLAVDYGEPIAVSLARAAPGGLLCVALLAFGTLWLWRRPVLGLAVWWIFLTLAPTSSFLPIQTEVGAERRMYLPLVSIIVVAVTLAHLLIHRLSESLERDTERRTAVAAWLKRVGVVAAAVVVLLFGVRTRARNVDYRDALRLWQTAFAARPENPRAVYNLGVRLSRLGDVDAAIAAYRLTIQIDPNYVTAHNNLGISLREQGDYAGAEHHFHAAATRYKNWTLALNNLARLYAACPDPAFRNGAEAVRIAEAICRSHPGQPPYLETLAAAYAEQGRFQDAVRTMEEAKQQAAAGNSERFDVLIESYQRGEPFRFPPAKGPWLTQHRDAEEQRTGTGG